MSLFALRSSARDAFAQQVIFQNESLFAIREWLTTDSANYRPIGDLRPRLGIDDDVIKSVALRTREQGLPAGCHGSPPVSTESLLYSNYLATTGIIGRGRLSISIAILCCAARMQTSCDSSDGATLQFGRFAPASPSRVTATVKANLKETATPPPPPKPNKEQAPIILGAKPKAFD